MRAIGGNLLFGHDGAVQAAWRTTPRTVRYGSADVKRRLFEQVRTGLMGVPPHCRFMSVCRVIDPAEICEAMAEGILDTPGAYERFPGWAEEVAMTQATLVAAGEAHPEGRMYRRQTYLLAELPNHGPSGLDVVQLAVARLLLRHTGPAYVSDQELKRAGDASSVIRARLTSRFGLQRVTTGELRWLTARTRKRAMGDEPILDDTWGLDSRVVTALAPLGDAEFNHPDDLPRHRVALRYVPVRTLDPAQHDETSYQTALVVSDVPQEWTYPGGELFARLDDLPFPVDWTIDLAATKNPIARRLTRKRMRRYIEQLEEWDSDLVGAPADLELARDDLEVAAAELAQNRRMPLFKVTIVFHLAATSLDELSHRVEQLKDVLDGSDYGIGRPAGTQRALYEGSLPGARVPLDVARDYARYLTPRGVAGLMPMATEQVGDRRGLLFGIHLDTGTLRPVLWDPVPKKAGGTHDMSTSAAFLGALGSGKSYAAKKSAVGVVLRGGRFVALDRTHSREWVRVVEMLGGQVVELHGDSDLCLDPFVVFADRADRERYALNALTILTGARARSADGVALETAVRAVLDRAGARLRDVVEELGRMVPADPKLRDLHAMLRNLAERRGLARMLFGDGQPLDLSNPAIVFAASGMALPDKDKHPDDWLPEEIAGMALLYLVAAITGDSLMRDARFGVAIFDEAYFLTSNPYGLELLISLARRGRGHGAALWLLAHDAADLADETLRGLFAYRFVGRMETAGAARRALEFLGAAVTDANVQLLQELNDPADDADDAEDEPEKGEFLFRDALARIALIRALADWNAARHEAFRTDLTREEVAA
jgi:hypothetical protein